MTELVYDETKTCKACDGKSHVQLDHISGDLVCTGCGLVLEERCFDGGADWRSFSDGGVGTGNDAGPARQRGDISTASFRDGEDRNFGTTMIGGGAMAGVLQKAMAQVDGKGRGGKGSAGSSQAEPLSLTEKNEKLIKAYTNRARDVASRLSLGEHIVQRVVVLLQDLAKKDQLKSGKQMGWISALVHIASREENATKSVREIAFNVADMSNRTKATAVPLIPGNKPVKKDELKSKQAMGDKFEAMIETALRDLTKQLGLSKPRAFAEDKELMARLVNRLQLTSQVSAPASHIVQQAYRHASVLGPQINRVPQNALMAVGIFIVAWLLDVPVKPTYGQVAVIARVPEGAVRTGYQLLHPRLRFMLPADLQCRLPGGINGLPMPSKA